MKPAKNPLPESLTPGGDVGYIVRNTRTSGFKLAIIVGCSAYKTRVRFWRAASKCWTQPTYVERTYLQALTDDEKRERAKLIAVAQRAARNFCPGAYL